MKCRLTYDWQFLVSFSSGGNELPQEMIGGVIILLTHLKQCSAILNRLSEVKICCFLSFLCFVCWCFIQFSLNHFTANKRLFEVITQSTSN